MNGKDEKNINVLQKNLENAQERLNKLEFASLESPIPSWELQQETITELSIALEELNVALEELEVQNQELLDSHEALAWERRRYQDLFELAPNAYIVTDQNLIIHRANLMAVKLLKVPAKHLNSKPLSVYIATTDYDNFFLQWERIRDILTRKCRSLRSLEGKKASKEGKLVDNNFELYTKDFLIHDWELEIQPRNSKSFPGSISLTCICDDQGNLMHLYWLIRDLTKLKKAEETRRQLEKEQQLRELQNRLFSMASHELRTPVAVVLSSVQNLLTFSGEWTEEKKFKKLTDIEKTAQNMGSLLDEIMLASRVELETVELKFTLFNLEKFVQELVQKTFLSLQNKQKLDFVYQGNCRKVRLDKRLLAYILNNLLSNAVKYSPTKGKIKLLVTEEEHEITLQVKDQGMGISEKDKPHIFERFYRGQNVSNISGLGLGLSLVKKCVELHKGSISLISEEGKGTTFTVKLKQG